ncbi:3-hydroxyacyl-CoA dehydrogenase family protein [Streptomyces benahoarensis]|uniref:3-hydroxyacyl-CoA dehydrogenase family protein n=1 Tax=Streptomyces benahoarensis TaxID=2595054 RepID=UPI00255323EA|nr:3-hydroxyacyl-CoA dehydrogenase family protein [Streptomyces benahoarensis]
MPSARCRRRRSHRRPCRGQLRPGGRPGAHPRGDHRTRQAPGAIGTHCFHPVAAMPLVEPVGLHVVASTATAMYEEYKEPSYVPPRLLLRMVEGGLLGRKTGRGFYAYD